LKDPTPEAFQDLDSMFGRAVIFLTGRDMTPMSNRVVLTIVSAVSLCLIILFSIGTFSTNSLVMDRLQANNALGDYDTTWLNSSLFPMLGTIYGIQGLHEISHLFMAWKGKFKISAPTILPALYLPFFGCSSSIKTSPKNYLSLFDFAISGPLIGIISSLFILFLGLQLTISTSDPDIYKYFPSLTSNFLHLSTLGSTIVTDFLGYDEQSGMPDDILLHPLAIGGFVSLYINALNLLPLGNTDGGRVAQALFSRNGHTAIQALTFLALLITSLFGGPASNVFLGYGLFCTFSQGELEIPCRDEITLVDGSRALLAIVAWFVSILVLVPVSQ